MGLEARWVRVSVQQGLFGLSPFEMFFGRKAN